MRISKNPIERKTEILDAAERLFCEKGYEKTTVSEIIVAVGISKGAFYYHFQAKEDVLDAIVMRFIGENVAVARKISEDARLTSMEKMQRIMSDGDMTASSKAKLLEQLHQPNNAQLHQKALAQGILALTPIATEVVEQGIRKGEFRTEHPKETVEVLLAAAGFLFDEGIFAWEAAELEVKRIAFAAIAKRLLGNS